MKDAVEENERVEEKKKQRKIQTRSKINNPNNQKDIKHKEVIYTTLPN